MIDVIAGRVNGAVTAKDARVVWTDGRLYVCDSVSGRITAVESSEPKRYGAYYRCESGGRNITFQPPGCGTCLRRVKASKVGRMSVEQIVAAGTVKA